jgi:hypothetical protein
VSKKTIVELEPAGVVCGSDPVLTIEPPTRGDPAGAPASPALSPSACTAAPAPPAQIHPYIFDVADPTLKPGARRVRCKWHHALAVTHWLYEHFATVTGPRAEGGCSRDPEWAAFVVTSRRASA